MSRPGTLLRQGADEKQPPHRGGLRGLGPRTEMKKNGKGPTKSALNRTFGGDEGNRTPNPRLAKAVLCQLSYVPWPSPRDRIGGAGDENSPARRTGPGWFRWFAGRSGLGGGLAPEVGLGLGSAVAPDDEQHDSSNCGECEQLLHFRSPPCTRRAARDVSGC